LLAFPMLIYKYRPAQAIIVSNRESSPAKEAFPHTMFIKDSPLNRN
jgi:hypothetical protein